MTRAQDRNAHPGGEQAAGRETVVVHGSDVHVERANFELPMAEARSRYGGVDVPAILGGALAGLGTAAVLGAIASAIGAQVGQGDAESLAVGGLVTALVLLALAGFVGGWVAGRSARFDGTRNGLLAGLVLALLLTALGAAGAYSAAESGLPVSLDGDRITTAAIIAAVLGLLVTLGAAAAGGRLGARWHRDVDDVVVGTRPGAVAVPGTVTQAAGGHLHAGEPAQTRNQGDVR